MITIDTEKTTTQEPGAPHTRTKRKLAKPVKKPASGKKARAKDRNRTNKRAEVIALMKRARGSLRS